MAQNNFLFQRKQRNTKLDIRIKNPPEQLSTETTIGTIYQRFCEGKDVDPLYDNPDLVTRLA